MDTIDRRYLVTTGLALGMMLGAGCPGDDSPSMETDMGTTGPSLCAGSQITCPDGTCQVPAPGACCGHGGLCESDDTDVDPTNPTNPTTTNPTNPTTDPTLTDPTFTDTTDPTNPTITTLSDPTFTTSSTTDGSSSSDEGSSSSSSGTIPLGCYDPLIYPYDGALCGPAAAPCVVQATETVVAAPAPRAGTPSLAVDEDCAPSVLLANSSGGSNGFFAQRLAADTWDVQATPFPMVQGGLDFDPLTGFWHAMVYEGTFDISARTNDGVWDAGDPLAGSHSLSTKAFAATGDPSLHGVLFEPGVGFRDTRWDGGWMVSPPSGSPSDLSASLAVAGDGTHHYSYWHQGGMEPELRWQTSAGDLELVALYGGMAVSPSLAQEITLTSPMGTDVPHLLAATETGVGGRVQVVYLRRDAMSMWTSDVVASEDPTGETTCDVLPLGPGELCTLDRTTYRPLAIVSSVGGDVRWFYSETHELVDYASDCTPGCDWVPLADMSTYTTFMGFLEGGVPTDVAILPDTRLVRANAEVDGTGAIHLIAYAEEIPDAMGTDLTVEYFRLEP
ncbi:MAG: hypothetical protein H6712_20470 [Myxococcales bacterium]|nr:hypothetical protein [Myxococcales bacterium]MCB9716253.1 hypothetical protein [Myxococcales bacterium]